MLPMAHSTFLQFVGKCLGFRTHVRMYGYRLSCEAFVTAGVLARLLALCCLQIAREGANGLHPSMVLFQFLHDGTRSMSVTLLYLLTFLLTSLPTPVTPSLPNFVTTFGAIVLFFSRVV